MFVEEVSQVVPAVEVATEVIGRLLENVAGLVLVDLSQICGQGLQVSDVGRMGNCSTKECKTNFAPCSKLARQAVQEQSTSNSTKNAARSAEGPIFWNTANMSK